MKYEYSFVISKQLKNEFSIFLKIHSMSVSERDKLINELIRKYRNSALFAENVNLNIIRLAEVFDMKKITTLKITLDADNFDYLFTFIPRSRVLFLNALIITLLQEFRNTEEKSLDDIRKLIKGNL